MASSLVPGESPAEDIVMAPEEDPGSTEGAAASVAMDPSGAAPTMHAVTPEGVPVPLTFNAETGQYVTAAGEAVVLHVEGGGEASVPDAVDAAPVASAVLPDVQPEALTPEVAISGLQEETEGLAQAAGTPVLQAADTQSAGPSSSLPLQTIRIISPEEGSVLSPAQVAGISPGQAIRIVNKTAGDDMPQVRMANSDGTVSTVAGVRPSPVQQQTHVEAQPQQGIRIVKLETGVQQQPKQQPEQQIRIMNADGSIAALPGNVRIVQAGQVGGIAKQIRVVRAPASSTIGTTPQSPTKTLTLAQAQQLGLLNSPPAGGQAVKLKGIRLSPSKGTEVVTGTGGARQLVIRQQTATSSTTPTAATPQVIRIPTGGLQAGGGSQIQVGNKVQYVRVVGSTTQPSQQGKGSTSTAIPLSALKNVKIAIPPAKAKAQPQQQRLILPQGQQLKAIPLISNEKGQLQLLTDDKALLSGSVSTKIKQEFGQDEQLKVSSIAGPSKLSPSIPGHSDESSSASALQPSFEAAGVKPRKPCNCTKSQCLKLYCDCFANGEFCHNCNCNNCSNNLDHEEERQKAIKQCLDRNSNAFKPKIGRTTVDGERRHNKGCNCKRSGCLKNYCECYEAKIPCTDACRCVGCKNVEEETGRKKEIVRNTLLNSVPTAASSAEGLLALKSAASSSMAVHQLNSATMAAAATPLLPGLQVAPAASATKPWHTLKARLSSMGPTNAAAAVSAAATASRTAVTASRQPFSFITPDVVEATCQCLLAQAEESERNKLGEVAAEAMVLEEFGRCLNQIIDIANKSRMQQQQVNS